MRRFDVPDKTEGVFHLATTHRRRDCIDTRYFRDGGPTRTSLFGGRRVRFRRVQTLVREGRPLVKLRNSA